MNDIPENGITVTLTNSATGEDLGWWTIDPADPRYQPACQNSLAGIPGRPHEDLPTGRNEPVTLSLTPFQAAEVEHGLDIDTADGNLDWGEVNYTGRRGRAHGHYRRATLIIKPGQENLDAALYRLTSIRDIPGDNAADPFNSPGERLGYLAKERSLARLVRAFIEAAGGPEAFSPHIRHWI